MATNSRRRRFDASLVVISVLSLSFGVARGLPQFYEYSEPSRPSPLRAAASSASVVSGRASPGLAQGVGPRILTEGQVFRTEVGKTLLLPCRTKNIGTMVLLWKKGSRVLTAGSMKVRRDDRISLQGSDLQIREIDVSYSGEYVCEVETDDDEPIQIVHSVEILVPPRIETQPSNGQVVVKKGTTISFTCVASGNPQPSLSWSKAHDQMPKSEVSNGGNTLTLSGVTRHHAGVYKCAASNGVGRDAVEEIHLQVLYEPEVKAERATVHAGVDYQVELVCVVYSEPVADVLWYKDTMLLDANGSRYMQQKGNRHTLLIRNVKMEDFGNYSCSASNMLGKARAFITVQGNPNTPVFNSRVDSKSRTSYKLSWITESYATIEEYRLLYRKLPDDPSQDMYYAYNNIIINGVDTRGFEHHQSYILDNLMPDSMYEAQIQAKNSFGWSPVSDKFQFYTRAYDSPPLESSVKNPASAPFGINGASGQSALGRAVRYINLVLAIFVVLGTYVYEQLWP